MNPDAPLAHAEPGARPDFSSGIHLPQVLNLTLRAVNERLAQELRRIDLPLTHWRVIAIIKSRGCCTLTEVAELTVIEVSTLSRTVKRLEEDGIVQRTWQKGDSRRRALVLTERGEQVFQAAWKLVANFYNYLFSDVSEQEQEVIRSAMLRVRRRLDRNPWDEEQPSQTVLLKDSLSAS